MDVSITKIHLDIFIFQTSISGRREYVLDASIVVCVDVPRIFVCIVAVYK